MLVNSLTSVAIATKPYLDLIRFSKPGGTLLVFLPHAYGLTMAAYAQKMPIHEYFHWLVNFAALSFVARSLGCTINDMCDYDFDRKVERTKGRPLASGQISLYAAANFLVLQASVYLTMLWTSDKSSIYYRIACIPLMFMYPLMKRITHFPQAWLGVAMNWGAVLAWATVYGSLKLTVIVPLIGGLWAWTMLYDTIYACQDRNDDVKIGIGSSALTMQNALTSFLSICAFMFVALLGVAMKYNNHSFLGQFLIVGLTALEMGWQVLTVNTSDPAACKGNLTRNAYFGCALWLGMFTEYYLSGL